MKKVFFEKSESCRDLLPVEISFILDVIWGENSQMRVAILRREADWTIRLETQRYIDRYSNIHGSSASFPRVTPKVTLLSLEDWLDRPEPKSAFQSQYEYRRFLVLQEFARAFQIPNTLFRSSAEYSFNNELIMGASNSEWMIKEYNSSSRTKLGSQKRQPIRLSPLDFHWQRET